MAAEVQEWVEGGEVARKVASQQEPLLVVPPSPTSSTSSSSSSSSSSSTTSSETVIDNNSSVSNGKASKEGGTGGEPALSVISDTLSEEYSSDSGKGGSDTTATPPDSINGGTTDPVLAGVAASGGEEGPAWNMFHGLSSYTAYSKSMGGVMPNHAMIYEFEIPQSIVGRLIGRYGSFVNKIKFATGANIIVKRHQQTKCTKICAVEGVSTEIEQAIDMIRERFPVKRYPNLTLEQVNLHQVIPASNISFIPNNRINLIEGVVNDVTVSCVVDLDHIFVQQPTHPTYPALARLHDAMKGLYEQPKGAPQLVRPFNPGVICVTKIGKDDWVRGEVVIIHEEKDLVTTRLVDVGGYVQVPFDDIRQIRVDFVTIPFQATECRLANIAPINENEGWSEEAVNFFKIICQGQVLQTHVVGYCNATGSTYINLYKPNGNANHILINEQMVTHNYAKWIDELDQQYFYTDTLTVYSNGEIDQLSQSMVGGEWVTLSPDLMTVVPTEHYGAFSVDAEPFHGKVPVITSTITEETDETIVPETDETSQETCQKAESSSSSSSTDEDVKTQTSDASSSTTTAAGPASPNITIVSWADEMDLHEEENGLTTEELVTTKIPDNVNDLSDEKGKKSRRKSQKKKH